MKKTIFPIVISLMAFASCTGNHSNMKKAEWLLGTWADDNNERISREIWTKINDSVYHSKSFTLINNDTTFSEAVVLNDIAGKMAYTVTVPSQNNAEAIRFEMTSVSKNKVVFENPKHDFPTKITYTKIGNDSLMATISGKQDGNMIEVEFPMKKIQ